MVSLFYGKCYGAALLKFSPFLKKGIRKVLLTSSPRALVFLSPTAASALAETLKSEHRQISWAPG